jgi:hypothetical protein
MGHDKGSVGTRINAQDFDRSFPRIFLNKKNQVQQLQGPCFLTGQQRGRQGRGHRAERPERRGEAFLGLAVREPDKSAAKETQRTKLA